MSCYDKFRNKMSIHGTNLRQNRINTAKAYIDRTYYDDPSLMTQVYVWEHGISDYSERETIPIRFYNRRFSNANGVVIEFQLPYEYRIYWGDVLYDGKANKYYMCTEVFDVNEIHWQGKVTECNWILKWQKPDGSILAYPCIDMNTTQYNSGETANRQFTIGSSQHLIQLPYDENTVVLETPRRFYLDRNTVAPTPFVVSQNDNTSYGYDGKGIVRLTLMESPANPEKDRPDLGLCDYIDPELAGIVPSPDNSEYGAAAKVEILSSSSVIKSGGDAQTYTAVFFDEQGNQTEQRPVWTIISDFTDKLNTDERNNTITISIDNDAYVDEELRLTVQDEEGTVSSSVIIRIESLL